MTFALDSFSLSGKVAVVTGVGARGNSIGEAYAKGLAAAGASVVLADLSLAGAEGVAQQIRDSGGNALAVEADIASPDSVARMADACAQTFGGADILVNNAAIMAEMSYASSLEYGDDDWQRMFAVNLDGARNCCRALVPQMRARGGGKIVNQVSAGAYPAGSVYGVTKIALVGLTTTLAKELGKDNINVNAIAPGYVKSDAGLALVPDDESTRAKISAVTLRPRGVPDDLVGPLLLLCSPAGSWIHGQVLHVDGGWILRP